MERCILKLIFIWVCKNIWQNRTPHKCSDLTVSHKSEVHIFQLMNAYTFLQDTRLRLNKMDFENFLLLRVLLRFYFLND